MSEKQGAGGPTNNIEWRSPKSTRQLRSSQAAGACMKEWFQKTRERVSAGEPFGICCAGEAEEIFITMDIPVVVRQWWSGMISAKQLSRHYSDLLGSKGYDHCSYCALGLGCTMDHNPERAPWGGLPKPAVIVGGEAPAALQCDVAQRINELWARESGSFLFQFAPTKPSRLCPRWWERIKDHWDEIIEPYRLDLRVEEFKELISFLEVTSGKTFSLARLREVMEMVNEQNEYVKKAHDLIAKTIPCPVSLTDQVGFYPAQWHRGTKSGMDLARMFYEEVKERAENHVAACPNEKLRLMWRGLGLWHNTAFYQYFEEKYGAVFVASEYLTIASDGYQRTILGDDPLRTAASRSVFLGRTGTDWFVKEAKMNKIDGAVQLIRKDCREASQGEKMMRIALENAGVPVITLYADNVDARQWDDNKIKSQVSEFIEKRLIAGKNINKIQH